MFLSPDLVSSSGLVSAPSCHLELSDKLQRPICRTVGSSLVTCLEPLAHRRNVASVFYWYYFCKCLSELAQLVPLPYFQGRSAGYSDRCRIFLSPFLDITRMSYLNSVFSPIARI